jgi:hypothetical protein
VWIATSADGLFDSSNARANVGDCPGRGEAAALLALTMGTLFTWPLFCINHRSTSNDVFFPLEPAAIHASAASAPAPKLVTGACRSLRTCVYTSPHFLPKRGRASIRRDRDAGPFCERP